MKNNEGVDIEFNINDEEGDGKHVTVEKEITPDLVIEIYEKAQKEEDPEKKKGLMAVVETLNQNIGSFLVAEVKEED